MDRTMINITINTAEERTNRFLTVSYRLKQYFYIRGKNPLLAPN